MEIPKIFDSEYRLACIVWDREQVTTRELVKLCAEKLEWKRTTTYTVLKRLCDRGIFQVENSVVTSRIPKEEIQRQESEQFVKRTFGGSLPLFLAAFLKDRPLSEEEVREIRKLIEDKNGGRADET